MEVVLLPADSRVRSLFLDSLDQNANAGREIFHSPALANVYGVQIKLSTTIELSVMDQVVKVKNSMLDEFGLFTNAYNNQNAKSIPHDYTFALISDRTDMKMSTIHALGDYSDNLTPDFIHYVDHQWVVIEFATCNTSEKKKMMESYHNKLEKYTAHLRRRASVIRRINYYVIVVSPTSVYTNLVLPDLVNRALVRRFNESYEIVNQLRIKGWNIADIDEAKMIRKVKDCFNAINLQPYQFKEDGLFCKALWDRKRSDPGPEPDKAYTKTLVDYLIKEAGTPGCTQEENESTCKQEIKEFYQLNEEVEIKRTDMKSIINLPYIISNRRLQGYADNDVRVFDMPIPDFTVKHDYAHELFMLVFQGAKLAPVMEENLGEIYNTALNCTETQSPSSSRRYYRRVKVNLPLHVKIELAKVGLRGSKYKHHADIKSYRDQKHHCFSMNVSTDDITMMMKDTAINRPTGLSILPINIERLIIKAFEVHSEPTSWTWKKHIMSAFKRITSTELYSVCQTIADIGMELAISLRQNTSDDEFIFKRLRGKDVYLIIKPSNSTGPLMFMVVVLKTDETTVRNVGNVFRITNEAGNYYWTDLISVNESKLVNWIKAESIYISVYSYALDYWGVRLDSDISSHPKFQAVSKLVTFLTMVALHDKRATEEAITMGRYIMCEGFKSWPEIPRPSSLLSKMDPYPRSRLQVFVTKCLIDESERITKICGFQNGRISGLKPGCMRCPYTSEFLVNPEQLINCFYYGYLNNKEEKPEVNGITKIIEKIIKEEDNLPRDEEGRLDYRFLGLQEPGPNLRCHEFSPAFLDYLCEFSIKQMMLRRGSSCMVGLEEKILRALSTDFIEDMATLKSSSNFNPELEKHNFKEYHRKKVAEAIYPFVGTNDIIVVDLIPQVLYLVEAEGALYICIFGKAQHGGAREIFVLDIKGRIVQKTVEIISKTICDEFPSETMTHPSNKYRIPDELNKEIKREYPSEQMLDVGLSDDAEKWSQRHIASKFFLMLTKFTPSYMHLFLFRSLALWEKKKLLVDVRVLNSFADMINRGEVLVTHNDVVDRLFKAYTGMSVEHWYPGGQGSTYLQIMSGMMQGILHYTSSLLHSIYLEWYSDVSRQYVSDIMARHSKEIKIFNLHLQSSDDSSMQFKLVAKKLDMNIIYTFLTLTAAVFKGKGFMSRLIGIYESSKKKKSNTCGFMEFNSEFFLGCSIFKPSFKFVSSCLHMSEAENLVGRSEDLYSLITQIPENGGSFCLASLCQVSQACLHYRLLGSRTSALFDMWSETISQTLDPSCGFFLLDPPFAAGIPGLNYNMYCATRKSTALQSKYRALLKGPFLDEDLTPEQIERRKICIDSTSGGLITKSADFWLGDAKKLQEMHKRLGITTPAYEDVQDCPSILYRRPENGKETLIKIKIKLHSPGVAASFAKTNAPTRIAASSTYIMQNCVMRIQKLTMTEESGSVELLRERKSLYCLTVSEYGSDLLSDEEWRHIFPLIDEYDSIRHQFDAFSENRGTLAPQHINRRKIRSQIQIFSNESHQLYSVLGLCSDTWFTTSKVRLSLSAKFRLFENMQRSVPWLRRSVFETLDSSPFLDHIRLYNYLASLNVKTRTVTMNGTQAAGVKGTVNMVSALGYNYSSSHWFTNRIDAVATEKIERYRTAEHCIYSILTYPSTNREAPLKEVCKRLIPDDNIIHPYTSRARLQIFKKFCSQQIHDADILDMIRSAKLGIVGSYAVAQRLTHTGQYTGLGVWIGEISGVAVRVTFSDLESDRNIIHFIETDHHLTFEERRAFLESVYMFSKQENAWCDWSTVSPPLVSRKPPWWRIVPLFTICEIDKLGDQLQSDIGPTVYFNPQFSYHFAPEYYQCLTFAATEYSIRIEAIVKADQNDYRKTTILHYKPRRSHLEDHIDINNFRDMRLGKRLESWLSNNPLSPQRAANLVHEIMNESDNAMLHRERKCWLIELLTASLRRNGIRYGFSIEHATPVVEDDYQPRVISDFFWYMNNPCSSNEIHNFIRGVSSFPKPVGPNYVIKAVKSHTDGLTGELIDDFFTTPNAIYVESVEELSNTMLEINVTQNNWSAHRLLDEYVETAIIAMRREQVQFLFDRKMIKRSELDQTWFKVLCYAYDLNINEFTTYEEYPNEDEDYLSDSDD